MQGREEKKDLLRTPFEAAASGGELDSLQRFHQLALLFFPCPLELQPSANPPTKRPFKILAEQACGLDSRLSAKILRLGWKGSALLRALQFHSHSYQQTLNMRYDPAGYSPSTLGASRFPSQS